MKSLRVDEKKPLFNQNRITKNAKLMKIGVILVSTYLTVVFMQTPVKIKHV